MGEHNLFRNVKATRVSNAAVAATTDVTSSSVDMQDAEGVAFMVLFGAITTNAVTSIKVQQSSDDGSADDFTDLLGSSQTVGDGADDKVFISDIFKPTKRYVRCIVDRGTQNAVVDGIVALQYSNRKVPVTHDSLTVGGAEYHASPAEGTA